MSLLTRLLARGTVVLANSASKLQSLQMRLTAGEVIDDMEHFEPYGFTSHPLAGAEGVATFLGGDRSIGSLDLLPALLFLSIVELKVIFEFDFP